MVLRSHGVSDTLILSAMGLSLKKTKQDCIDVSFTHKDRTICLESIQSSEFSKTCIEHVIRSILFGVEGISYLEDTSFIVHFSKVGVSWTFNLLDGNYIVHSSIGSVSEFIDDLANLVRFFELSPSALTLEID